MQAKLIHVKAARCQCYSAKSHGSTHEGQRGSSDSKSVSPRGQAELSTVFQETVQNPVMILLHKSNQIVISLLESDPKNYEMLKPTLNRIDSFI